MTEEVNKFALSANGDIRLQSINSIGTYAYGTKRDQHVRKKNLNVMI